MNFKRRHFFEIFMCVKGFPHTIKLFSFLFSVADTVYVQRICYM